MFCSPSMVTTVGAMERFGNAPGHTTITRVGNRPKLLDRLGFSENRVRRKPLNVATSLTFVMK